MTPHNVPDEHRIARYCTPSNVSRGSSLSNDTVHFEAFIPKSLDQNRLSMNWLETFSSNQMIALHCIRCFYGKAFDLRRNGRFVVLETQDVKGVISAMGQTPAVFSDPTEENPSHILVLVDGSDPDLMQVAMDLAALANNQGMLAYALSS